MFDRAVWSISLQEGPHSLLCWLITITYYSLCMRYLQLYLDEVIYQLINRGALPVGNCAL